MTSYQIVEFLDSLPRKGIVEVDIGSENFYIVASSALYEVVGDDGLKVTGEIGYGMLATVDCHLLLDSDEVKYIRHTLGTKE